MIQLEWLTSGENPPSFNAMAGEPAGRNHGGSPMLTPLGRELRKLRIEEDERMLDMAKRLEVSVAFLSAVETARKEPPLSLADKVIAKYRLDDVTARKLRDALSTSRRSFRLAPATPLAQETAGLL